MSVWPEWMTNPELSLSLCGKSCWSRTAIPAISLSILLLHSRGAHPELAVTQWMLERLAIMKRVAAAANLVNEPISHSASRKLPRILSIGFTFWPVIGPTVPTKSERDRDREREREKQAELKLSNLNLNLSLPSRDRIYNWTSWQLVNGRAVVQIHVYRAIRGLHFPLCYPILIASIVVRGDQLVDML